MQCPHHGGELVSDGAVFVCQAGCRFPSPQPGVIDLLGDVATPTSDHYSLQWGAEIDFASFYREQRAHLTSMTSRQMGWPALIDRIRQRAGADPVRLYDAACGYGGLFMDLFEAPPPPGLRYVGADIHEALGAIARPPGVGPDRAQFVRWDISNVLPTAMRFDVIICRAAIHHTPDPYRTFQSLAARLAPGGTLAITAYAKKSPMREATDDALRAAVVPLPPREALAIARQFTSLGKDLQASDAVVEITHDLPLLRIKAGRYGIQEFVYNHFMKCWFNDRFGDRYSDVVNFDWYHPPFAFRYDLHELERWFAESGIDVVDTDTTPAQHYLEGRRPL